MPKALGFPNVEFYRGLPIFAMFANLCSLKPVNGLSLLQNMAAVQPIRICGMEL